MPEINFFWDPLSDNILQERDAAGAVTAAYTTEPGLYGNVISQKQSAAPSEHQFHYDAVGSTLVVTTDNPLNFGTRAYTAFGETTEITGGTISFPYQYIGRKGYYTDDVSGGIIVRPRLYEPVLARWMSVDPLGYADGLNRYEYVGNTPTVSTDPSGLSYYVMGSLWSDVIEFGAAKKAYYLWTWRPIIFFFNDNGTWKDVHRSKMAIAQRIYGSSRTDDTGGTIRNWIDYSYNEIFSGFGTTDFQGMYNAPTVPCDSGTLTQSGWILAIEQKKSRNPAPIGIGTRFDSTGIWTHDSWAWTALGGGWIQRAGFPKTIKPYVPEDAGPSPTIDPGQYNFAGYSLVATHTTKLNYSIDSANTSSCDITWEFKRFAGGKVTNSYRRSASAKPCPAGQTVTIPA